MHFAEAPPCPEREAGNRGQGQSCARPRLALTISPTSTRGLHDRTVETSANYICRCACRVKGNRFNHDFRAKRLLIAQRSIGDLQRMSSSVVLRLAAIVALDQSSQVRLKLRLAPFIGAIASSCLIKSCFFASGRATEAFSGAA